MKKRPTEAALMISRTKSYRSSEGNEPPTSGADTNITFNERLKRFFAVHWKGFALIVIVAIAATVAFGLMDNGSKETDEVKKRQRKESQIVGFTTIMIGLFWVLELIPLPISALIPCVIFPIARIMDTIACAQCYFNTTIALFLSSLYLASAIEQSGLHTRIAMKSINLIGYSHKRMLASTMGITVFVSMWITNTAATSMMLPIMFAMLKIFEENNVLQIFKKDATGEEYASDLAVCYFSSTSYAATIGGIGTLVGSGTNLVLQAKYIEWKAKSDSDHITFLMFSLTTIPIMVLMSVGSFIVLAIQFLGMFRGKSKTAEATRLPPDIVAIMKQFVKDEIRKLGNMKQSEIMALVLFLSAMLMLFLRSPEMFKGWSDYVAQFYNMDKKKIKDSDVGFLISFLMLLLPAYNNSCRHCSAKFRDECPKEPSRSVVDWNITNDRLPYSFAFLLGGGFALSEAANSKYSNFINFVADGLQSVAKLQSHWAILVFIVFTVFITNFCSNVVCATLLMPLAMKLAPVKLQLPYAFAVGLSASYCFCVPVGTPGNLIVQSKAKVRTLDMIKAGFPLTLLMILINWLMLLWWPRVVFGSVMK